jgi:peptidyl-dipeptidase A
MHVQALERTRI